MYGFVSWNDPDKMRKDNSGMDEKTDNVVAILSTYVDRMERVEKNEVFINLVGFQSFGLEDYCLKMMEEVKKETGIQITIGIAKTKTLARLANIQAQKNTSQPVSLIASEQERIHLLKNSSLDDVWLISEPLRKYLSDQAIYTAFEYVDKSQTWVRKHMAPMGEKIWKELHGTVSFELECKVNEESIITTSRAFGKMLTSENELSAVIAHYAGMGAEKLKEQNYDAGCVRVYIHTNTLREDMPQYYRNCTLKFPTPTNDVEEIVNYAMTAFQRIYKDGYRYKKAGVTLYPANSQMC